jgi:hypothetical protein
MSYRRALPHRRLYCTIHHFGLRPPVSLSFRKKNDNARLQRRLSGANRVSRHLCLK